MQKQVDHKNDQSNRDHQGLDDLFHAFRDRECLVERYRVIDISGKALLHLCHELTYASRGLNSVRSGQLIYGDTGRGLAVQATHHAVVLSAQFDSSHVFHANSPAIWRLAHDDVAELLRRCQTTLSQHRIGELLVFGLRFASNLTSRIDRALRFDRINNVRNRDAQLR